MMDTTRSLRIFTQDKVVDSQHSLMWTDSTLIIPNLISKVLKPYSKFKLHTGIQAEELVCTVG